MAEKEKKPFKDSKVGKFLSSKGLDVALETAGKFVPGIAILSDIKDMVLGDTGGGPLTSEEKAEFMELYKEQLKEYDAMLADTANARDMQKAALAQDDLFSKRYVYYLASFWSLAAVVYIFIITLIDIPEVNIRFADTVLGFMLGTAIATILNFFFGSTARAAQKDKTIQELIGK